MTGPQDQPPTTATGGITDPALATDRVVAAFGGIRPMAQKLGTPVTTVQGWKKRGHIPEPRHPAILAAAGEHKIDLDAATLAATAAEGSTGTTGADAGAAGRGARVGPEAEPPRRPSPAAKPPQVAARAGGSRVPGLALGLAAIALIGTVSAPFWTAPLYRVLGLPLPVPTGGVAVVDDAGIAAVRDRLNAIERRLGDLAADAERGADDNLLARIDTAEARLAAVEQIATPALADRLLAIDGALDALASDLARLDGVVGNQRVGLSEARTALTGLESAVEELATALESLADAQARDSLRIDRLVASDSAAQAFVLAIGQLRAAVDTGRPYDQTLAALRGLSAGDPDTATDLSALVTMSGFGIPTRERLKAEFPAMAAAAREADRLSGTDGWVDDALASVRGLVSIRPAPGEVSGDDVPAVLARAENRLDAGDLDGAHAEVVRLEGPAATAAESWRTAATARLEAEAAVARLYELAIGRLAESGAAPTR